MDSALAGTTNPAQTLSALNFLRFADQPIPVIPATN
jgi:hypothetical protein